MLQNYYELLGIPNNAVKSEIKRAYRKLALKWHPDKNPANSIEANQRFKEICEAYQILFDDRRRRIYDHERYRRAFDNNNNNYNNNGSGGKPQQQQQTQSFFSGFNQWFAFKSPDEIFREEFGNESPKFYESMDPPMNYCSCYHGPNDIPHRNFMAFMRDPFTNMTMNFDEPQMDARKSATREAAPVAAEQRNIVVTTKYVDGRKMVTKRYQDNQGETILLYENGKLISKTFNCWFITTFDWKRPHSQNTHEIIAREKPNNKEKRLFFFFKFLTIILFTYTHRNDVFGNNSERQLLSFVLKSSFLCFWICIQIRYFYSISLHNTIYNNV